MKALVTGGAGFLGRHLVAALSKAGHEVRVLDLKAPTPPCDFHQGSILDPSAVQRAASGMDWIFHLAAIPHLWLKDKNEFERVNHQGTLTLLAAAKAAGVKRFIHTSSEVVFRRQSETADDAAPPRLDDMPGPYARSKLLAERAVLQAAAEGLPALVVNPTVPLGPGDVNLTPPAEMLLGFLNGKLPAYLNVRLSLADARDLALGQIAAAERGRPGERYLLAGENIWLADLLHQMEAITGLAMPKRRVPFWLALTAARVETFLADRLTRRPPKAPLEGVRITRLNLAFDCTKAKRELGYSPRPFDQTLRDTLADLRSRGLLAKLRP